MREATDVTHERLARPRARTGVLCAAALAAVCQVAWAEDGPARLRLAALAEEGDLLLEEIAQLDPIRKRDSAQAQRLAGDEKKLAAEVVRIEKDVSAYNKAVGELAQAAADHAGACPSTVADSAVEQCNERGAKLMDQAAALDRRHTALQAQQEDVNKRVQQHNRARDAWLAERRESAPRLDASAADIQRWVTTARSFMTTPEFATLKRRAGEPPACAKVRVDDAGAHFGEPGLRQLHGCLKAVLRAL
jgi:hypothetical protein